MTELEALAKGLSEAQRHDLELLCFTNGRLRIDCFDLPTELLGRKHTGGLLPMGVPTTMAVALRAHLLAQSPAASLRAIAGTSQEQEG